LKQIEIHLTHSSVKDLNGITGEQRSHIIGSIKSLTIEPFAPASKTKKLKGFKPPLYRKRAGDHRILYRVTDNAITIMRIVNRKDLVTIIKRLKEDPAPYT
jgi:mRNA-degrading endonuclease RelE of RelBE toxin-antitoxin system